LTRDELARAVRLAGEAYDEAPSGSPVEQDARLVWLAAREALDRATGVPPSPASSAAPPADGVAGLIRALTTTQPSRPPASPRQIDEVLSSARSSYREVVRAMQEAPNVMRQTGLASMGALSMLMASVEQQAEIIRLLREQSQPGRG
jgi:hypothetical protein